eukprot:CAMPEP_0171236658 /NCGR_PEP_ID=MMETSP0790-20130122/42572_1 /TAXON_ID=2925 /ORGANISM="Alexandrium catenella, Strain OF101" /LENGTH=300 /DNA_ID=CAMNT_0011703001 /DNA_START=95 /DNA_END=997 /DNA_ORIENTATION=+
MAGYGAVKFQPTRTLASAGPYESAKATGKGRLLEDPLRQVYVGNLSYKLKWQELKDHFKQVGEVENARILTQDGTDWGRSRGVGIIRFKTEAEAQAAIARLNGTDLQGRAIVVDAWTGSSGKWKAEQEERGAAPLALTDGANGQTARPGDWICSKCGDLNFARNTQCRSCGALPPHGKGGKGAGGKGFGGKGCGKVVGGRANEVRGENLVYVGNLKYEVKWKDLKDHMKQAGNVEFCNILTEDGTDFGRSKGVGCVRYSSEAEVQQAIAMLNETDLMGRNILVDLWTEGSGGKGKGKGKQ